MMHYSSPVKRGKKITNYELRITSFVIPENPKDLSGISLNESNIPHTIPTLIFTHL